MGRFDPLIRMHTLDLIELLSRDAHGTLSGAAAGWSNVCSESQEYVLSFAVSRKERFAVAAVRLAVELHVAMKHPPYETMARLVEQGVWRGIDASITPALLRFLARKRDCVMCAVMRWNQLSYKGGNGTTAAGRW